MSVELLSRIDKFKSRYPSCFEEGVSIAGRVLGAYSAKKSTIAGEIFGLMFVCGQPEFRVDYLLFEQSLKLEQVNSWCLDRLGALRELGCNERLLTSAYLNFWNRSEGRVYGDVLNGSRNAEAANWVRLLTGFSNPFYSLCLAIINPSPVELVYAGTASSMRIFIDDLNDVVSIEKDRRRNVLNVFSFTPSPAARILSKVADILELMGVFGESVVEKLSTFMIDYIQWHLESSRYSEMSFETRRSRESWIQLIGMHKEYVGIGAHVPILASPE
ncbi:hypothetical protein [Lentzea jiangxiensis]|uniref:hypothetical protein n=1 Tax=Lentzea jiangxiensis TaxID=641025 RepID=UPI00115FD8A9|nr:hypothetical protein [Lentzea jiangxiensis]